MMDRKTLLAIGLSFLIFVGWQKFYIEPRTPRPQLVAQTTAAPNEMPAPNTVSPAGTTTPSSPALTGPTETFEFATQISKGKINDRGEIFTAWQLTAYQKSLSDKTPIDLESVAPLSENQVNFAFDSQDLAYLSKVKGKVEKTADGYRWSYDDEQISLVKMFSFAADRPYVTMKVDAQFKKTAPKNAFLTLNQNKTKDDHEEQDRQMLVYNNGSIERKHVKDISSVEDVPGPIGWVGVQSRYFLVSAVPSAPKGRGLLQNAGVDAARVGLSLPVQGSAFTEEFKIYFGPKETVLLNQVDPTLTHTIDLGFFGVVAMPILKFMKWLHVYLGNWGLAIIILTLAIKLVTFPLTYKSMISMKKMAALQPEIEKIRTKYKDDKEALNRELMTYMRTNGYNPISGCFPMLIQMPVFFALYRVLYSSIELYQSPFFFWIKDLSLKDPFYVTPVILTGVMFLQQKMTPNTISDPVQAKMMQWMPVFFGVLMINLPAGLTLYMLVNAIASIVQQVFINRKLKTLPAPATATA